MRHVNADHDRGLIREPTHRFLLKVISPVKLGVQLERSVGKVLPVFSSLRIQRLLEPQAL